MPQSSFEIRVRFLGGLSGTQREVFELAAARWTELITADVPSVDTDIGVVTGLVIDAAGTTIDGPGKILGRAGPTKVRYGSLIPARGADGVRHRRPRRDGAQRLARQRHRP